MVLGLVRHLGQDLRRHQHVDVHLISKQRLIENLKLLVQLVFSWYSIRHCYC